MQKVRDQSAPDLALQCEHVLSVGGKGEHEINGLFAVGKAQGDIPSNDE